MKEYRTGKREIMLVASRVIKILTEAGEDDELEGVLCALSFEQLEELRRALDRVCCAKRRQW